MEKKSNFGPTFNLLQSKFEPKIFFMDFPLLDCCMLSLYAISRKTNEPDLRKWQKA